MNRSLWKSYERKTAENMLCWLTSIEMPQHWVALCLFPLQWKCTHNLLSTDEENFSFCVAWITQPAWTTHTWRGTIKTLKSYIKSSAKAGQAPVWECFETGWDKGKIPEETRWGQQARRQELKDLLYHFTLMLEADFFLSEGLPLLFLWHSITETDC